MTLTPYRVIFHDRSGFQVRDYADRDVALRMADSAAVARETTATVVFEGKEIYRVEVKPTPDKRKP